MRIARTMLDGAATGVLLLLVDQLLRPRRASSSAIITAVTGGMANGYAAILTGPRRCPGRLYFPLLVGWQPVECGLPPDHPSPLHDDLMGYLWTDADAQWLDRQRQIVNGDISHQ